MKKPINRHLTWVKPLNPILEVLVRKRGEATMSSIPENVKRVYKETLQYHIDRWIILLILSYSHAKCETVIVCARCELQLLWDRVDGKVCPVIVAAWCR